MNMRDIKCAVFEASKMVGLFRLSRFCSRRQLRILCYHGFALGDENSFRPKLFMNAKVFEKRLAFLKAHDYPVLFLEEALSRFDSNSLPSCATVITIDDGFYSVFSLAAKALKEYAFPATLYVTSYYVANGEPVFRLAIQYMFWKTGSRSLSLDGLHPQLKGSFDLTDDVQKESVLWTVIRLGEEQLDESQRVALALKLGERLSVEFERIRQTRALSLVNAAEIQALAEQNVDIELHTHRHRLPHDDRASLEIADNRRVLEPLLGRSLAHFCYPSGLWSTDHWRWLEAAGIRSATTCEPGLNRRETPRLALKRFLDSDDTRQIEFEAEMCGFAGMLRELLSAVRRVVPQGRDSRN